MAMGRLGHTKVGLSWPYVNLASEISRTFTLLTPKHYFRFRNVSHRNIRDPALDEKPSSVHRIWLLLLALWIRSKILNQIPFHQSLLSDHLYVATILNLIEKLFCTCTSHKVGGQSTITFITVVWEQGGLCSKLHNHSFSFRISEYGKLGQLLEFLTQNLCWSDILLISLHADNSDGCAHSLTSKRKPLSNPRRWEMYSLSR